MEVIIFIIIFAHLVELTMNYFLTACAHSSVQFGLAKVANGSKFGLANKILN